MSNRLFNGEALPGGVPGPEGGRWSKSALDRLRSGLYTFIARDGQVNRRGVG